MMLIAR